MRFILAMPRDRITGSRQRARPKKIVDDLFIEKLKVFISSKMRRNVLRKEREAAKRAIKAMPFCEPWGWEDAGYPNSFPPMELCLAEVRNSSAFVLILGSDFTTNTYREFNEADGKYRMVLNKQCRKNENAKKFLRGIQRHDKLTYRCFRNPAELKSWIARSLKEWFNPVVSMKRWSEARILSQVPYPDIPGVHEVVIRTKRSKR